MCFFLFLSSLWHHLFQLEVREGPPVQQLRSKELERWVWFFFNGIFHLASLSVSSQVQPAVPPFWEYWKYIRYCKRREKKEHPLHGHATSGGQQTNRRSGSSPGWAESGWTDNDDEEMRWSPPLSMSQRERWHWFEHDGTRLVSLLDASGFPCAGKERRKTDRWKREWGQYVNEWERINAFIFWLNNNMSSCGHDAGIAHFVLHALCKI